MAGAPMVRTRRMSSNGDEGDSRRVNVSMIIGIRRHTHLGGRRALLGCWGWMVGCKYQLKKDISELMARYGWMEEWDDVPGMP